MQCVQIVKSKKSKKGHLNKGFISNAINQAKRKPHPRVSSSRVSLFCYTNFILIKYLPYKTKKKYIINHNSEISLKIVLLFSIDHKPNCSLKLVYKQFLL